MSHDLTSLCDGSTAHYSTVKGRLKFGPKSLGHQNTTSWKGKSRLHLLRKVAGPQHRSTVPRLPLNNQLAKTTSDQIASEKSVLSPAPAQVDSSASGQCGHLSLFAIQQRRLLQPVWQLIQAFYFSHTGIRGICYVEYINKDSGSKKEYCGMVCQSENEVVAKLFWTGGAPDLIQRKIKDNCT
ncbi:hypothetical protein PABG_11431 [Paracoccidioides brasiliensis Pb03]|nr:hypothetical protein PABG_11431 [Paracoccidioides brasiliensis Pb03]